MNALQKRWGKLPVWTWVLIALAAILLTVWLRRNWTGETDEEPAADEYGNEIAEYYEPAGDDFFTGAGYAEDYESGTYPSPVEPVPVEVIVTPGQPANPPCVRPPRPPLPQAMRGRWVWRFHRFKNTEGRRYCGRWKLHRVKRGKVPK